MAAFATELDWVDEPGGGSSTRPFWLGTAEAAALVAASASGGAPAGLQAVLQALLDRPEPGAARLLSAAVDLFSAVTAYSGNVIVSVAMGLNAALPRLLPAFVRVAAGILPDVLVRDANRGESRLLSTYGPLLKCAAAYLPESAFCHFYLNVRERALLDEAEFLLTHATLNPEAAEIASNLRSRGFRREAKQLAQAARQRSG